MKKSGSKLAPNEDVLQASGRWQAARVFDSMFPDAAGGVYSLGHASPEGNQVAFPVYAKGRHVGYARATLESDGTQRLKSLHRPIEAADLDGGSAEGGSADVVAASTGAPETKVLDYTTFPQLNSNWSWAAVSASAQLFLRPGTHPTTCGIVGIVLGNQGCCTTPTPTGCNEWKPPEDGLSVAEVLDATVSGAPAFSDVTAKIDASTPVVAWFKPTSGGDAAFTFYGYTAGSGVSVVYIADPNYGYFATNFSDIPSSYSGGGSYESYDTTKAPSETA